MSNFQAKNFFKVYLSDCSCQSMRLPPAVVCSYELMPVTVTFRNCEGQCWHVELEVDQSNDNMFFKNGWRKFVEENSIKDKDLLVFNYVESFLFDVKVFMLDGCEKSILDLVLSDNQERGNVLAEEEEDDGDDDNDDNEDDFEEEGEHSELELEEEEENVEILDGSNERRSRKKTNKRNKGCHKEFAAVNNGGTTSMEVEDEELCPEKYVQDSNPYFVVRIRQRRKNELYVPADVIKDYGLTLEHKEEITFLDPDKRRSIGQVDKWKDGRTCITGWGKFCRLNRVDLQHDKCICEFLLGKEQEDDKGQKMKFMQVHIIRCRKHV
ncbi:hypothetical protein PTKIN_Ptkin02bG0238900 [Pterospermum kingtungense]